MEQDLGRSIALQVAQMMVVFLRRPAGQSQFSATLNAQTSENHSLNDLIAWLPDNLEADLSIDGLAKRAAMSPRNFARLFRQEMGKTPGKHIEDLRLESARRQLESTSLSLAEVADACGLASAEILRRHVRTTHASHAWPIPSVIRQTPWTLARRTKAIGSNRWFFGC